MDKIKARRQARLAQRKKSAQEQHEQNLKMGEAIDDGAALEGVTKLYRHECAYNSCPTRYSKFADNDAEQDDLKSSMNNVPIIHRHYFNEKKWYTESFTVQSPAMRAHLQVALAKYQDFDLELENWTFTPPYKPIVHRWDRLKSICEETIEPESKEAIDQLMDFLKPIVAPSVESLAQTRKSGKVSFENVWQIFPPSELAATTFFDVQAICRVLKYEKVEPFGSPPYWVVTLEYVDWNGERCGYATTKSIIKHFQGMRFVTSLPVFPLSFSNSAPQIKSQLIERGRKFERLRGYHLRTCVGTKVLLETEEPEERPVAGRVIIDGFAYYQSNKIVKPKLRSLTSEDEPVAGDGDNQGEDEDAEDVAEGPAMTAAKASKATSRTEDLTPLNDEQCLLTTPWVRGLDLKTKEWAQFLITDLAEIVWNDEAFNHLVLPGNEKELAWAFVENKAFSRNQFDDFVQDKGRGIIILMFGPPGVGKTYTAEAVAERSRVPLYSMSAGMLGTSPKAVEAALERALELCTLWNAMLLLDEVDVFLGARTDNDLARNELVAVFLTKLEYYQGICFLTTNRITSLDHAFQSRVDLFLPYADLTPTARRQVWKNFIAKAGRDKFDVSDEDLDMLSKVNLNGREIKNLIKSAHLLSLKGNQKITTERLHMLAQNRLKALDSLSAEA